jgi:enoyl-[acyl-carrier protein] reductase I
MAMNIPLPVLTGAKAPVVGVANDSSVACGHARAFQELGADLALTYLNDKAHPRVEPIARQQGAAMLLPLDVSVAGQLEAVFAAIERDWERPDILVHSIAWAPKEDLPDGLLACSAEGFGQTIDVSCNLFIRMARLAAPLIRGGGTMIAMGCYEANCVVPNYVMGPAKAALETSCRCLACELRPQAIRVHAMSPGPLKTGAASGAEGLRPAADAGRAQGPAGRTGRHHGRRLRLRLSGHPLCTAHQRRDRVRRRRSAHHGVNVRLRARTARDPLRADAHPP